MPLPSQSQLQNNAEEEGKMYFSHAGKQISIDVTKLDRKSTTMLHDIDADKSGDISLDEILQTKKNEMDAVKTKNQFKKLTVFLLFAICGLLICTFASCYVATDMTKEVKAKGDGTLVTPDGTMTATKKAEVNVKLFHAPVLDMEHLREVKEITYVLTKEGQKEEHVEAVTGAMKKFEKYGDRSIPHVVFTTALGTKIRVDIMTAELFVNGERHPLCGEMKCSSLQFEDPALDVAKLDEKLNKYYPADISDANLHRLLQSACEDGNCGACDDDL